MPPQRPLRVSFVSTMSGLPWGGSEQLWSETALRLRAVGVDVSASVYRWPARPVPLVELERRGVHLAFRPRRRHLLSRTLQKCFQRLAIGPVDTTHFWWLKRTAPDLVVISQGGPWDGVPWTRACARLGLPYCPVIQANSELWWPHDAWLDDINSGLAGARRVYFVCEANRRLMELQCGRYLLNAEVIANPCQVDRAAPVPWPPVVDRFHLACVGRMSPEAKGQDVLFEVLAQPKWRRRPLRLNLYGAGPSERSIRALATLLGLAQVRFRGHSTDIPALWAENHALVLPSRYEGLPLTIVEAMLCGRLVITTAVAGNAEMVSDNVTGFIAPAATPALLDEAMERAWARRAEWEAIGRRARARALQATPADPVGEFTEKLLELLTGAGPGREPVPAGSAVDTANLRPHPAILNKPAAAPDHP